MSDVLLSAALQYAAYGWRVLPLWPVRGGICTCVKGGACKSPGKHPTIRTGPGHRAASSEAIQIERWWRRWPEANIGAITGIKPLGSGFVVVDVDSAEGAALLRSLGELPSTLAARSGRAGGGLHLFYSVAKPVVSSSGGGLDLRGEGGLVVLPPSQHASGAIYAWL